MQSAKIFSGTSSELLTQEICKRYGTKPGKINIQHFSDGEMCPTFTESIRGFCYLFATFCIKLFIPSLRMDKQAGNTFIFESVADCYSE